jgi:hypothetical protein
MKVEVKVFEENQEEIKFPCLMISNQTGNIVLFSCDKKGVVLLRGENPTLWKIGDYGNDFAMENFKPFKGSITLSND